MQEKLLFKDEQMLRNCRLAHLEGCLQVANTGALLGEGE